MSQPEQKKKVFYKKGDLIFCEEYVGQGLKRSAKRSSLYSMIIVSILAINQIAAYSVITSLSNLVYEPDYFCKKTSESLDFTVPCTKEYVCNPAHVEGQDYILDKKTYKRSLVTDYGIYCDNTKIASFGMSYYIGGVVALLLLPVLLSRYGNIVIIVWPTILCIFCNIGLLFITNYYLGIIIFAISMVCRNLLQMPCLQYLLELAGKNRRGLVMSVTMGMQGMSGLLVNVQEKIMGDYKGELLANTILFVISIILTLLLIVESPSNSFVRGEYDQIITNFEYIFEINNAQEDYIAFKKQIEEESRDFDGGENEVFDETNAKKNKYEYVSYASIWGLKGYPIKLIFFLIFNFINQFGFIFLLYEVNKSDNFYLTAMLCYTFDVIGSFVGGWLVDIPCIGRRNSSIIFNCIAAAAYAFTGFLNIFTTNDYIIILNRFLNAILQTIVNTYGFEIFATCTKVHALTIARVGSRLFNVLTPILMVANNVICYFIGAAFDVLLIFIIICGDVPETVGKELVEMPEEFKDREYLKRFEEKKD